MPIKSVGGTNPTELYRRAAYGGPAIPFLLGNNSATATIYYNHGPTITPDSSQIPPLGFIGLNGEYDVWASTLTPGVQSLVDYVPGGTHWAANPNITAQLDAAGLAKDSTLQAISATLISGVAPNVPNINSVAQIGASAVGSPYTVFQMPASGRIWGVCLSASVQCNNPTGTPRVYFLAQVDGAGVPGNGTPLAILEMGVVPAITLDSDVVYVPFNGLAVNANQNLYLIVNGGTVVTNVTLTASAIFFYSVP